jgi:hypothetical protein
MRSGAQLNLPLALPEYSRENEQQSRRAIEQRFEDIHLDIRQERDLNTKASSLALRRLQFLLMGAGNG